MLYEEIDLVLFNSFVGMSFVFCLQVLCQIGRPRLVNSLAHVPVYNVEMKVSYTVTFLIQSHNRRTCRVFSSHCSFPAERQAG